MKKIYAIDWKAMHPNKMPTATDQYYVGVANEVMNILKKSGIDNVFPLDEAIRDAALRLTAWFEDICTSTGFWRTVNETCQKRYGKPLPFYDTSEYYPGEPNPQDVAFLLWDIIESWNDDRFINPENPGLLVTATKIFDVFDSEFEYAPDTDELRDYLTNPALGIDYWATRRAMEWFSLSGYLSLHSRIMLEDALDSIKNEQQRDILSYTTTLANVLIDKHNMLSLTAAEWLSAAIKKPFTIDHSHLRNRLYTVVNRYATTVQFRDILTGDNVIIEEDSLNEDWLEKYSNKPGTTVSCGFIQFNDKCYQCGTMITDPDSDYIEEYKEKQHNEDYAKSLGKQNYDHFYEASGGKHIIFLKGEKELTDFYTKEAGITVTPDFERQLKDMVFKQADDGMLALMATRDQGFLIISLSIPAIKAPGNPFYNEDYAKKHASDLLLCSDAIEYSAVCTLLENNYLPDAALNSHKGYEYGRKMLQDNAQFIIDYMFAEHK